MKIYWGANEVFIEIIQFHRQNSLFLVLIQLKTFPNLSMAPGHRILFKSLLMSEGEEHMAFL